MHEYTYSLNFSNLLIRLLSVNKCFCVKLVYTRTHKHTVEQIGKCTWQHFLVDISFTPFSLYSWWTKQVSHYYSLHTYSYIYTHMRVASISVPHRGSAFLDNFFIPWAVSEPLGSYCVAILVQSILRPNEASHVVGR